MKKRYILVLITIILLLTGCTDNVDIKKGGTELKNAYEALNTEKDIYGIAYNKVTIPEDNPFIIVDIKTVLDMCKKKKNFILYIDTPTNQWGRTYIERIIEMGNENNLDIYYLDITNDRDEIKYRNKTTAIINNGTIEYQYLLDYLKDTLSHYMLYDDVSDDVLPAGEGRIYDGNLYYIHNGNAIFYTYPKDSFQFEYTDEIDENIIKGQKKAIQSFIDEMRKKR